MEKICIVKLRKKLAPNTNGASGYMNWEEGGSWNEHGEMEPDRGGTLPVSEGAKGGIMAASEKTVSFTLTREQAHALAKIPQMPRRLSGELLSRPSGIDGSGAPLVVKFEFEELALLRMLTAEEVLQMLRIGNGALGSLVRDGHLKSYKVGRFRRFMLEDILSYLEKNVTGNESDIKRSKSTARRNGAVSGL